MTQVGSENTFAKNECQGVWGRSSRFSYAIVTFVLSMLLSTAWFSYYTPGNLDDKTFLAATSSGVGIEGFSKYIRVRNELPAILELCEGGVRCVMATKERMSAFYNYLFASTLMKVSSEVLSEVYGSQCKYISAIYTAGLFLQFLIIIILFGFFTVFSRDERIKFSLLLCLLFFCIYDHHIYGLSLDKDYWFDFIVPRYWSNYTPSIYVSRGALTFLFTLQFVFLVFKAQHQFALVTIMASFVHSGQSMILNVILLSVYLGYEFSSRKKLRFSLTYCPFVISLLVSILISSLLVFSFYESAGLPSNNLSKLWSSLIVEIGWKGLIGYLFFGVWSAVLILRKGSKTSSMWRLEFFSCFIILAIMSLKVLQVLLDPAGKSTESQLYERLLGNTVAINYLALMLIFWAAVQKFFGGSAEHWAIFLQRNRMVLVCLLIVGLTGASFRNITESMDKGYVNLSSCLEDLCDTPINPTIDVEELSRYRLEKLSPKNEVLFHLNLFYFLRKDD